MMVVKMLLLMLVMLMVVNKMVLVLMLFVLLLFVCSAVAVPVFEKGIASKIDAIILSIISCVNFF